MGRVSNTAVIDADGHVVEPLDLWERHLDPKFRARAPRFTVDDRGRPCALFGERYEMRAAMVLTYGPTYDLQSAATRRAGGWDPVARLADMDAEGIDAAVLYPSLGLFVGGVDDPVLQAALCRAYDRWRAEYCATDPKRLIGVAMLPLADLDAAVAELEHAVERDGFRAAFVRPNPVAGRPIHHPANDRLWDCAAALGVPIAVHEGLTDLIPTLGRDRFENPAVQHVLSHPFEQMAACAGLILTGVLERHPTLRVAFLESGAAWLPYWLARLDSHFETWRALFPQLTLRPSEYFARQCAISTDPDEAAVDCVVEHVGDGCVVWASDYPHPDAHFPGAVAKTLESMSRVPEAARAKILGGNAARLYGIASR